MKATMFQDANDIRVEDVNRPQAGMGEAVVHETRMWRPMSLVQSGWFEPTPLVMHRLLLDEISPAYQLFSERSDCVLNVAI